MRVEEIFRGERYLFDEEEEDSSASANEAVPPATVAIVEGLANRKICASRPRIGERRIFFANPMDAVTLVKNIISFFSGKLDLLFFSTKRPPPLRRPPPRGR